MELTDCIRIPDLSHAEPHIPHLQSGHENRTIWDVYAKQRRERTSEAEHSAWCSVSSVRVPDVCRGCRDYSIADWSFLLCKHLFGVLL